MICVVIKGPTYEEASQQMAQASQQVQLIELRLDCFTELDFEALKKLRSQFSIPMIFTLRSSLQGGNSSQSEENRLIAIRQLATLKPEYLDLESYLSPDFIAEIASQYPTIKLILSYHNFTDTPKDLETLYLEMRKIPASLYKIAVTAKNSLEALQLLCWAKEQNEKVIAISMGYYGQLSRILGPIIGTPITYAALDGGQETTLGQLSAITLVERYHYQTLTPQTLIYGLIGNPVDQSISDKTHNHFFEMSGLDAVYVKTPVTTEELPQFLRLAKKLPFQGLSVTMPLKEVIIPHLDQVDDQAVEIGAVNTLLLQEDKWIGFNTDGIGALNALEQTSPVKGKRIIIIGAGGAAKAIAYEAHQRGGSVTLLNRSVEKAHLIASRFHCQAAGLDQMADYATSGYEVLINSTPLPLPISADHILSKALVMDIKTKPQKTLFLQCALHKGCRVTYGYQMFVEQALGQFYLWFKNLIPIQRYRKSFEERAKAASSSTPVQFQRPLEYGSKVL